MPALPIPTFAKMLSVGAAFGGYVPGTEDFVTEDTAVFVRAGARVPDSRVQLEFSMAWASGQTRVGGYDERTAFNRLDVLAVAVDDPAFGLTAGGGVGWRTVNLDEGRVGLLTPAEALGFRATPAVDFLAAATVAARVRVWGPLSVRADVSGGMSFGEEPATEPTHARPIVLASVGVDVRWSPPPDRDRDGVPDKKDKCPDSLEDWDFFDDADGCLDPDDDKDGITDPFDQCKGQAEDMDGYQDEDGCEDHNDDADAFPDADDRCRLEAETENGWEDGDGCPDVLPPDLATVLGRQKTVVFGPDDALLPESAPRLDELAAALLAHPAVVVQIKVTTDASRGPVGAAAQTLVRAKALHAALLARNVPETRLLMVSAGDRAANISAATEEARALDRWVEVTLVDSIGSDGKPIEFTPVPPERW